MSSGAIPPSGAAGVADANTGVNPPVDFPQWIPGIGKSVGANSRFKRALFYLVLFLSLSFLGVFAGMVSWLGSPGSPLVFLILVKEQVDPAVLPISFGAEDHKALISSRVFDRLYPVPETSPTREEMLSLFEQLLKVKPSEKVVVYLSARSMIAPDGTVVILPSDALVASRPPVMMNGPASNLQNTVKLSAIYQYMADCPAQEKLLVLDVFQQFVDIPAGVANFDLPGRSLSELESFQSKQQGKTRQQFNVLFPCMPGQRSVVSSVLKKSVFCHFLVECFRGRLTPPPDCPDMFLGKVFLSEMTRIIGPHMDRWAMENHLERQYPHIVGPQGRFFMTNTLTLKSRLEIDQQEEEEPVYSIPKTTEQIWQFLQELSQKPHEVVDNPRFYSKLFFIALNSTIAHLNGIDQDNYTQRVALEFEKIRSSLKEMTGKLIEPGVYPTLGMLMEEGLLVENPQAEQALIASLKALEINPPKAGEQEQAFAKMGADFLKAHPGLSDVTLEDALLRVVLSQSEIKPVHLAFLSTIGNLHHKPFVTAEARLMLRFSQAVQQGSVDSELVRKTLGTNKAVNLAMSHWMVFPWASQIFEEMAEECLIGTWLAEKSPNYHRREAVDHLEKAGNLASFVDGFEKVLRSTQKDIWLAGLDISAFLSFPTSLPPGWHEYTRDLREVVETIKRFPPGRQLNLAEANEAARQLRQKVDNLERSYDAIHKPVSPEGVADYEKLVGGGKLSPASLITISSFARLSGIPKADRLKLLNLRQQVVEKLGKATLDKERNEREKKIALLPVSPFDSGDMSWGHWRGEIEQERVRLVQDTLTMAGVSGTSMDMLNILGSRINADGSPGSPAWGEIGSLLRKIFVEEIPEKLKLGVNNVFLMTILYPGWLDLPILDDSEKNPLAKSRNARRITHLAWLDSRFQHNSRLGIDAEFWNEKSRLVSRNLGTLPPTGIKMETPNPVIPPSGENAVEIPIYWITESIEPINPQITIHVGENSPFVANLVGKNLTPGGGNLRIQIRRANPNRVQLAATPTEILVELHYKARVWPVIVTVLPDLGATFPSILLGETADDTKLLGDDLYFRGSNSVRTLFPRIRALPGKPAQVALTLVVPGETPLSLGPVPLNIAAGATVPISLGAFGTTLPGSISSGSVPSGGDGKANPANTQPPLVTSLPGQLTFQIQDLSQPELPPVSRKFNLRRVDPSEIVELVSASSEPQPREPGKPGGPLSRVKVGLRARRPPLNGPPCRVELTFDDSRTGGAIRVGSGNANGILPPDGSVLFLEANGITNSSAVSGMGEFTLNIDGFPMLFRFSADLEPQLRPVNAELVRMPVLGLKARFIASKPDPTGRSQGTNSQIAIEAWGTSIPVGGRLRASLLGGPGFSNVEKTEVLASGLKSRIGLRPHESGGWDFTCDESLWSLNWNADGLKGSKQVRLELLSGDGKILSTKMVPLLVDPTPIVFTEVVGLPTEVSPGGKYSFLVVVDEPESGVKSVTGFMGSPVTDAGGVQGPPVNAQKFPASFQGNLISAEVVIPADVKSAVTISIQAINGAGQSTFLSRTLNPGVPKTPPDPSIFGTVTEGDRPQADLTVVLLDSKGKEVASAKTNTMGEYRMENLKKGSFTLEVSKRSSGRKAKKVVDLQPGPAVEADLKLLQ